MCVLGVTPAFCRRLGATDNVLRVTPVEAMRATKRVFVGDPRLSAPPSASEICHVAASNGESATLSIHLKGLLYDWNDVVVDAGTPFLTAANVSLP